MKKLLLALLILSGCKTSQFQVGQEIWYYDYKYRPQYSKGYYMGMEEGYYRILTPDSFMMHLPYESIKIK